MSPAAIETARALGVGDSETFIVRCLEVRVEDVARAALSEAVARLFDLTNTFGDPAREAVLRLAIDAVRGTLKEGGT